MRDTSILQQHFKEKYIKDESTEWFELNVSPTGLIHVTLVSNEFTGKSVVQREDFVLDSLLPEQIHRLGFMNLLTVKEANDMELSPRFIHQSNLRPKSWIELANRALNPTGMSNLKKVRDYEAPRAVAFYSYKGGVGRTTALAHVASILAKRGHKILVIDLDLEAPSLHLVFSKINPQPQHGIVEYLYERSYSPTNTYQIHVTDLFGEVHLEDSPGRLFVIPAGKIDLNYLAKVDDLRVAAFHEGRVWNDFIKEVSDQIHPDIILIDSRTGINEWGAFSLLTAADDVVLFMYPNEENYEGISVIANALNMVERDNDKNVNFVLTKVPSNKDGKQRALKYWERLNESFKVVDEDETENGLKEINEPLTIYYNSDVALSDTLPVEHLTSIYAPIANLIDEESEQGKLKLILSGTNRWEIIESLTFETVDAKDEQNDLGKVFQKTADYDKFIDENTVVIHGQKGTGKTALYWMMLKHLEQSKKLARGRLDDVVIVSGHGSYRGRPGKEEFRYLANNIDGNGTWEAIWRGYAILRLYIEGKLPPFRGTKFSDVQNILKKIPKKNDYWTSEHTNALKNFFNSNLSILTKDYLMYVNEYLKKKNNTIWLLYDDLDEDIQERSHFQNDVLSGLFYFIRSVDAQRLSNIKFKTFIREDIWNRLNFTNKSHFNGRDVLLQWSRIDFMRLAVRQALYSGYYKQLVDKYFPIQDIDSATEESLIDALQILWGMRREKNRNSKYVARWVYERLTDASGTTFPRVLGLLLSAAKEHELQYIDQSHIPSPSDRLLRSKSLNEGLINAAKHRSQELREEYPDLEIVMDKLTNLTDICGKKELELLYKESQIKDFTLDDFIKILLNIGLISEEFIKGEIQYRFADLYVHGFGMKRSHGRKF